MKLIQILSQWLETKWITPAYSGWVIIGIAICFFGAATNTMAGWLYVLSGTMIALLIVAAILPARSLKKLQVRRLPIVPVSAGEDLTIELEIENLTNEPQTLIQIWDFLPYVLSKPEKTALELIKPHNIQSWVYYLPTHRRGLYHWHEVQLRSGTPLGLFWCSRSREVAAKAIVYPQVLPLTQCPIIDAIGQDESTKRYNNHHYHQATEGVTRTLRPYRYGDSTRLIHWRTSARLGEFRVRELEVITGGQDIIICLDTTSCWQKDAFEQAVIAAASLYFYAQNCQMNVKLWTANTGLIYGNRIILETLALVEAEGKTDTTHLPQLPLIWITQNSLTFDKLPVGSRWMFFNDSTQAIFSDRFSGLIINLDEPLQQQLQKLLG